MRPQGCAERLEERRRPAVGRVLEGSYEPQKAADFLGVDVRSVYRWLARYRHNRAAGLSARPVPGRPPKLTAEQAQEVLSWLEYDPQAFGFPISRWTAPRLALVVQGGWSTVSSRLS